MNRRPSNLTVWFGVLGGALAWIVQHAAGYFLGIAQCDIPTPRWHFALQSWDAGLAAAALVVALASLATAWRVFLRTRGEDNEIFEPVARGDTTVEPLGRIQFLATLGLTVNPMAIAIIVMDGIGAPLLRLCHQV